MTCQAWLINDLPDHLPIFLLIKTNTTKVHDKKPIIKRDFTNFDSEMFLETISHNFQHLPQTEGDPSKDWSPVPRYIRGCCLMLERRYGFRASARVGKALI